ncbi:MAG: hypothetical protein E7460_07095 [Ruminococcaceae bacterium]|nr:hypothetical protein [Oscillospiraceae bacterium]
MNKKLPKRKPLRLPYHDYGTAGAYFVTVCTLPGTEPLSELIPSTVGAGASTAPNLEYPIQTLLTPAGMIVEKYLLSSEQIPGVTVDSYVIMPDHIHVIFIIEPQSEDEGRRGAAPYQAPANAKLPHIISAFKRFANKDIGHNIFQRSYYDHVIRNRGDYETRVRYIYENPARRYYRLQST